MVLAQELGYPIQIRDAAEVLSVAYEKENKWNESLDMYKLFVLMRDSIRSQETEEGVLKQKSAYELEKKEQEIELLSVRNEVQKLKLKKIEFQLF